MCWSVGIGCPRSSFDARARFLARTGFRLTRPLACLVIRAPLDLRPAMRFGEASGSLLPSNRVFLTYAVVQPFSGLSLGHTLVRLKYDHEIHDKSP